jgi:hypothetical protein
MSGNLFLQKGNPTWLSPAVVLATPDGNYTVTNPPTPTTINVQVSLMKSAAYEFITVEVWVCDPTTNPTPSNALFPFQPDPQGQRVLTGVYAPPNLSPISTVPVIQVTGFVPYPAISSLPAGHCCLIANCYGTTPDGTTDGVDLLTEPTANFTNLVQNDQHVAQHNIFADVTPPGPHMKVINFPFRAATSLREGAELVRLEIAETPPAQLRTMLHSGLPPFQGAKFGGLRLEISERPVKFFGLTGLPKEGRAVELELEACKSEVLTATVDLDPAERPGAAHAFDIVQRDAKGMVQGGLRLVTIVGD